MKIDCRMKKIILIATAILALTACQKSMEDRAAYEARAYTQKYCPTPVYNSTRTDSLVFDRSSRTFVYHCSLTDLMDDGYSLHTTSKGKYSAYQELFLADNERCTDEIIFAVEQDGVQHSRKKSISNQ